MINANFHDRRDSVRVKRIVTVRHRLFKRNGKKCEDIWQLSTTEDMSYSGLRFSSVLPYRIGDVVELQVVMSGVLYLFNGYAEVVRVIKEKGDTFHVAVRYVDLKSRRHSGKEAPAQAKSVRKGRSRSAKKIYK
jgi:hypothetical protein